jgi:hypothetical protein
MTYYRADNTDGLVPARDFPSLEAVPRGVGYNRVTTMGPSTGEFWLSGAFPDQAPRWFRYGAPRPSPSAPQ